MAGGGEGAKERRRLQRLQQKQAPVPPKPTPQKDEKGGKRVTGKKSPFVESSHRSTKPAFTRTFPKLARLPNNSTSTTTPLVKKKKINKPKHLKRKLEQAEDTENREEVLQVLRVFEAEKAKHSKQRKRKKPKHANPASANEEARTDGTAVEMEDIAFPRSNPVSETREDHGKVNEKEETLVADEASQDTSSNIDIDEEDVQGKGGIDKDLFPGTKEEREGSSDSDDDISGDDDDSDDDDDVDDTGKKREETDQPKRERGRRRRRGRKDTSKEIQEKQESSPEENPQGKATSQSDKNDDKTKKGKKDRYCVGRKPVTDFEIGQQYSGKVVYVKDFGVFFDIGCHSDAFCHVSRLRDDYVEKPHALFHEGQEVENIRVVEIDRRSKRLTVSLQSDQRVKDEQASAEARAERKRSRKEKESRSSKKAKNNSNDEVKSAPEPPTAPPVETKKPPAPPEVLLSKDPSQMTPAEQKRARKLARRAARRDTTGGDVEPAQ